MTGPDLDPAPVILADWDEEIGPIIVQSTYPGGAGGNENNPEVLVSRCYISAQSIFAKEEFSKIRFNLPMVSISRLAVVLFDTILDPSVRGAKRPFLLVIFTPLSTAYAVTDEIVAVAEPCIDEYKNGRLPDLASLQDKVALVLARGVAVRPGTSGDELKQALSGMLVEHAAKLSSRGVSMATRACPQCGDKIYPDEVSCTSCMCIVRTYCPRCNGVVDKGSKYCKRCGMINLRYEEEMERNLTPDGDDLQLPDLVDDPDLAGIVQRHEDLAGILDMDVTQAFDDSSARLQREIDDLKGRLEGGGSAQKHALFETFTRDYSGFRQGNRTIADQAVESSLKEPAVDEIDLVIKSMAIVPEAPKKGAPRRADPLVAWWPCEAYVHARGQVLVGRGMTPAKAKGVPGVLLVTDHAIIFVSHVPSMEGGVENLFSYFDASVKAVSVLHFEPAIDGNAITFAPHGMLKEKFGELAPVSLQFSWATAPDRGSWDYQAFTLQSTIEKLATFERPPVFPLGKYLSISGATASDPRVRAVLVDLQESKTIAGVLRAACPGLGLSAQII